MNKYNNKRVLYSGILFASMKERDRYIYLREMEKQGRIKQLDQIIPKNDIFRAVYYIADFVYSRDGEKIVEDVKGYRKGVAYNLFKIKQKLMYHVLNIVVKEV